MGNKVTITDLNGLSDYATSIREFVHQYEEQIASVRRTFDTQVTGSEADAISAFYDKLNDLQQRVFDQFPAALRSYEEVVSTYHNSVSGLGFSRLVKSQVEDAENVAQLLSKNQLEAIKTITAALQGAFNDAATAMGTTPESVSSINTLSEQVLTDAANSRKTLGSDLDEAYRVFVDGLKTQTEAIKSLNTSISNVAYVTSIPVRTIYSAIHSGRLTADEMYYFNLVSSKEDAQALKAVLSQDYAPLSTLKTEHISDSMYMVLSKEMVEISNSENLDNLNNFVKALGEMPQSRSTIFIEGLAIGADKVQLMIVSNIIDVAAMDQETRNKFENQSRNYNNFIAMISLLEAIHFGAHEHYVDKYLIDTTPMEAKLIFSGEKLSKINVIDIRGNALRNEAFNPDGITYNVDNKTNDRDHKVGIDLQRIKALEKARQNALAKFLANTAITGASYLAPEVGLLLTMADAVSGLGGSNGKSVLTSATSISDLTPDQKKRLNSLASVAQGWLDYQKNLSKLDKEGRKAFEEARSSYLGSGGFIIEEGDDSIIQSRNVISVSATLIEKELDTKGFTGYLESRGVAMKRSDFDGISSEMVDYTFGQSDLTFAGLNKDQLKELAEIEAIIESETGQTDLGFNRYIQEIGFKGLEELREENP